MFLSLELKECHIEVGGLPCLRRHKKPSLWIWFVRTTSSESGRSETKSLPIMSTLSALMMSASKTYVRVCASKYTCMFTVQLVDILCCSVAYITSGQYCATWLTVVLNTCALSHFHRWYYSSTRWPDLMSTFSWMRLASTCRNEGKEAVTSLAKEPSLRFLANGGGNITLSAAMGLEGLVQIGRASCRERV